jgi:hypothetical protein
VGAQARRAERQQRFAADLASIKAVSSSSNGSAGGGGLFGAGRSAAESEQAIGSGWLALHGGFGTNRSLEKQYLRLTSVPKAEDVRPPEVRARAIGKIASFQGAPCRQLCAGHKDRSFTGAHTHLYAQYAVALKPLQPLSPCPNQHENSCKRKLFCVHGLRRSTCVIYFYSCMLGVSAQGEDALFAEAF